MPWAKAGSTTLQIAGDTNTVSNLTNNKFIQVLNHKLVDNGLPQTNIRLGTGSADSNNNYSFRRNRDGTSSLDTNVAFIANEPVLGIGTKSFSVVYISDVSGEQSLSFGFGMNSNSTGGNAPKKQFTAGRWQVTTDIDTIQFVNTNNGDIGVGTNTSVLGSDGTESTKLQDGAIYYETDTNKEYLLYNNTWTEL